MPKVAAAFGVDRRGYNEMPWVYQTAYRVEALLAAGVAVGFNSDRHTRVAIACDDTHLLCVDSYGPRHQVLPHRSFQPLEPPLAPLEPLLEPPLEPLLEPLEPQAAAAS